ncbi:hypothetical protein BH10CHL1_BH10CHL1_36430 [soil metagenome]
MTANQPQTVRLRLICPAPPPSEHGGQPTEFGLLDKKQILHAGVAQIDHALHFACEIGVKPGRDPHTFDYTGLFVHGPVGGRFLYWGWRVPGETWIRRWKIPLVLLTSQQIELALRTTRVLQATITDMQRATTPLLGGGWSITD